MGSGRGAWARLVGLRFQGFGPADGSDLRCEGGPDRQKARHRPQVQAVARERDQHLQGAPACPRRVLLRARLHRPQLVHLLGVHAWRLRGPGALAVRCFRRGTYRHVRLRAPSGTRILAYASARGLAPRYQRRQHSSRAGLQSEALRFRLLQKDSRHNVAELEGLHSLDGPGGHQSDGLWTAERRLELRVRSHRDGDCQTSMGKL
mmetsp:Transcript_133340/g.298286  ORF Transcript_133340/g.298286 Transcript_133340/m.298286 type:complete len:205 (-) Transcript_133340:235-849(-)